MAVTEAGRALTFEFRRGQLAIRARMLRRLRQLWPSLDVRRLDSTAPEWLRVSVPVVADHRHEAARAAAAYYQRLRAAEAPAADPFRARWLDQAPQDAPVAAIRQSLIVTGPVEVKKRTARLAGLAELESAEAADRALGKAQTTALTMVEGAATRHVLDGGREVLREEAARDRVALAFARVSDGDPCYFCALMISRGFVYRNAEAAGRNANDASRNRQGARSVFAGEGLYKFHDNCACTVEPVFVRDPQPSDQADKFAGIYTAAAKSRRPGQSLMGAFRAAYDAQR